MLIFCTFVLILHHFLLLAEPWCLTCQSQRYLTLWNFSDWMYSFFLYPTSDHVFDSVLLLDFKFSVWLENIPTDIWWVRLGLGLFNLGKNKGSLVFNWIYSTSITSMPMLFSIMSSLQLPPSSILTHMYSLSSASQLVSTSLSVDMSESDIGIETFQLGNTVNWRNLLWALS